MTRGLETPWRAAIWGGATLLLLAPLVAMNFARDVHWSVFDFMIAGALLYSLCAAFEICAAVSASNTYRLAAGIALVTGLMLIWANLAVGVIGNEDNSLNRFVLAVPFVAICGAVLARLKPAGMSRAMAFAATAQAAIAILALSAHDPQAAAICAVLTFFWLVSAALFRQSRSA